MEAGCCELLPWDSEFFGRRVARVLGHRLHAESGPAFLDWCERERVDCIYLLAEAGDAHTAAAAAALGFAMVDVRVTFARRLEPDSLPPRSGPPHGFTIRPATPADLPALEAIAGDSFKDSRFWFDEKFERAAVAEMYRVWIRKSVHGYADGVLVLDGGGKAHGFITCRLTGPNAGEVPLAGLSADVRGRGLAQVLYAAALDWFAARGVATVRYVTQARNVRAQRVLQRLGFLIESAHVWYHKWFDTPSGGSAVRAA